MVKQINIAKALIRYNGKYLLLKKANDTYFPENIGKWECSGVLRETKQETGLEDKIVKELPSLRMTDENYDSQCKVYLLEAPKKDIILDPKKHSKYKWVAPENIKNMNLVLYTNLLLEFFNNPEIYLN